MLVLLLDSHLYGFSIGNLGYRNGWKMVLMWRERRMWGWTIFLLPFWVACGSIEVNHRKMFVFDICETIVMDSMEFVCSIWQMEFFCLGSYERSRIGLQHNGSKRKLQTIRITIHAVKDRDWNFPTNCCCFHHCYVNLFTYYFFSLNYEA